MEIVIWVYLFHPLGIITHITTNLNRSEIGERYEVRVRSRMGELFNPIAFHKKRLIKVYKLVYFIKFIIFYDLLRGILS